MKVGKIAQKTRVWGYAYLSVITSLIFVLADATIHFFSEFLQISYYTIPFTSVSINPPLMGYAVAKFIITLIALFALLIAFQRWDSTFYKSVTVAGIIVILLELRYLASPYSFGWHTANLLVHFGLLSSVLYATLFWQEET